MSGDNENEIAASNMNLNSELYDVIVSDFIGYLFNKKWSLSMQSIR